MTKLWHVGKYIASLTLRLLAPKHGEVLTLKLCLCYSIKDFSENDLTGHLPTVAIQKLVNLEKFHVHQSGRGGDGIIGQLPAFDRQTKLHMLDINSNSMTGSIPSNFLSGVEDVGQLMEIE